MNRTKEKNFISVVVYVRDNENQIENFINSVYKELDKYFAKFEFIFVNDASTDSSVEVIRKCANKLPQSVVSILKMSYFQGIETAMVAGKRLSIGDYIFEFDSLDLNYDISLIYEAYLKALDGYDIVSTRPNIKGRISSKVFYKIFNLYSKVQYKIGTETFRVISRRGMNRIDASSNAVLYRKATYANCGLRCEVILYESIGDSNQHTISKERRYREKLAVESLILHTDLAFRLSTSLTVVMMIIAMLIGIYTLVVYTIGHPVAGWTTTMFVLAIGFFGIFAILTMVVRYLTLILELTFKRQQITYEGIEKISF